MTQPPGDDATEPSPVPGGPSSLPHQPPCDAPVSAPQPGERRPSSTGDGAVPAAAPDEPHDDAEPFAPRPGDGGVIARVRRRTTGLATLPLTIGLLLALTGWGWPRWLAGAGGLFLGGLGLALCLLAAGMLLRRARLWSRAAAEVTAWSQSRPDSTAPTGWVKSACGSPVPLHSGRGSIPLLRRERRFPARVLPLKAAGGLLAAGYAVIVHARADGAMPAPGDELKVLALTPHGPILIGRVDGVVFAADRWTVGPH